MKILGYLLIGIGLIDLITSWTLDSGSPIDPIVGPTIAPFTAYILLGVGYYVKGLGGSEDVDSEE
jgi:hypothetical protein|tara:strand:+ start:982 stop:1176 length:195 start_codon:yes stop_codon:yes gene_type:complete